MRVEDFYPQARDIIRRTKEYYSPNGIVDDALNQGDPSAPSAQDTLGNAMRSYIQYLPQFLQTTTNQILPTEQANLNAAQKLSPAANQLSLDQAKQFLPQFTDLGNQISGSNITAGATNAANILGSQGQNIANKELGIDQSVNPEYYSSRALAGNKLGELLNSINLSGLSGGERAEVERSVNRQNAASGNVNVPSAINTVSNAMNFGSALQQKQGLLSNAINTAVNFLPTARSQINPIGDTLSAGAAGSAGNPATNFFLGANTNPGANTFGIGNSLFGAANSNAQQTNDINANRRNTFDMVNQAFGSLPNIS